MNKQTDEQRHFMLYVAMSHINFGKLCGLIRELHQAGGKDEALALADQFIQEYKRRPAMLDELAKLKRKLTPSAKRNNVGSS